MLREFLKFSRVAKELIATDNDELTVAEFLAQHGFSREFHECYFLPMGSAVWSCPRESFENFPARFVAEFYQHHGMLSVWDRPQWQVIRGGSSTYVHAALAKFHGRVMLGTPVARIKRTDDEVTLHTGRGEFEFDHVIFACHADQALSILGEQSTAAEREILSAFPYEKNEVVLHTDTSLLPRSPRAWACWNYHVPQEKQEKCTVTYNMNLLQSLAARETYLVTLNASESIDPARILRRFTYHHPVFSRTRSAAQRRQGELLNARRISFCGAYWRNGFHEDGVVSALAVCHALQGTSRHAELSLRGMGQPSALAAH